MISGIVTAILLVSFLVGVIWAYSDARKPEFDAAAQLPLLDGSAPTSASAAVDSRPSNGDRP